MNIILVNPDVTQGTKMHSICGRSGKVYGKTRYSAEHGGHIFEMSESEYKKAGKDILRNGAPLQFWVPTFSNGTSPEAAPDTQGDQERATLKALLDILATVSIKEDSGPLETLSRIVNAAASPSTSPQLDALMDILQPFANDDDAGPADTLKRILAECQAKDTVAPKKDEPDERTRLMELPLPELKKLAEKHGIKATARRAIVEAILKS